jgi:hypothetical protein
MANTPNTFRLPQGLVVVVAFLIAFIAAVPASAHESDRVVAKVIEAYGGREKLSMVRTIAAEGRIVALMRGDEGTYRRTLRRDGSLFVDIVYSRSSERRILHKGKGYRGTGGKVEEVSGPRYLAMVYQYNELDLPYGLLDGTLTASGLRKDTVHGEAAYVFRLADRAGSQMDVVVNAQNYRIVKCTGTFVVGTESTSLSAEFEDFRTIDGILLPFKIVNYAGGMKISMTTIDQYFINPAVDDALFRP